MAILITGGTGFIGRHLVSFLKAQEQEVILFGGDITRKEDVLNFAVSKSIEAVIHLAAVVNDRNIYGFQKVNVEGTKNILELCKRVGAERLVFLSTIRVSSDEKNPYVDSKREAERAVEASGVPYVILRPSLVYGPGDKKNIGFILRCARFLRILPALNFSLQPLFVEDLTRVIRASLRCQTNRVLNITGPEVLTFKEVLKNIQESSKRKILIIDWPRVFGWILRGATYLPFFPIPRWQVGALFANYIFKGDDWERLFNIRATRFAKGLKV